MDKSPSNKIKELLKIEESLCVRDNRGIIRWVTSEGILHRIHGTAFIQPDGYEECFFYGNHHREDSPAIINQNHGY